MPQIILRWQDEAHVGMTGKTEGCTPERRLWIAYAQQWCTQTRLESLRAGALTDSHASKEYSANSVLKGLPELAKSISCKGRRRRSAPGGGGSGSRKYGKDFCCSDLIDAPVRISDGMIIDSVYRDICRD